MKYILRIYTCDTTAFEAELLRRRPGFDSPSVRNVRRYFVTMMSCFSSSSDNETLYVIIFLYKIMIFVMSFTDKILEL